MMEYSKQDAIMMRGFAALCMVILHLFCRQGADVFGQPLIWLNETTPLVFLFGFFAEIAVPLYSISAGYARQITYQRGAESFSNSVKRIIKLLRVYWIVLLLFCILGLYFDKSRIIPGNGGEFIRNFFLISSYNGSWWYLRTYVILLLIPYKVLMLPIKKLKLSFGLILCFAFEVMNYALDKFAIWESIIGGGLVQTELKNFLFVLPYVWAGAILCRFDVIKRLRIWYGDKCSQKQSNMVVLGSMIALFMVCNIIHKFVLCGIFAVLIFILFALLNKHRVGAAAFLFLGEHSTVIWLSHMFFYLYIFEDLVFVAKYPVLILLMMLTLCIATSYCVKAINKCVDIVLCHLSRTSFR